MFYVVYAKVTGDKRHGVKLSGVHFGGHAATQEEAECIARECVNSLRGGTIMPKIFRTDTAKLPEVMKSAVNKFERIIADMTAAAEILNRGKRQ